MAGNYSGLKGERSATFWPFWHLMEALKAEERAPTAIVLENVCGALTSHKGKDFKAIGKVVVAVQESVDIPNTVTPGGPDDQWHSRALIGSYERLSKPCRDTWVWWHLPQPQPRETALAHLIEEDPIGVKWHTRDETRYLLSLMSDVNRQKVKDAKNAGHRVVGTIYRRTRTDDNGGQTQRAEIRFDDIAGCLRTPVGGSSRQTVMIVDGTNVRSRLLSPREAARLMGLPDDYKLPENYNDAYYLAGDGLVVPVVRYLAAHVLEPVLSAATEADKRGAA